MRAQTAMQLKIANYKKQGKKINLEEKPEPVKKSGTKVNKLLTPEVSNDLKAIQLGMANMQEKIGDKTKKAVGTAMMRRRQ